MRLLIHMIIQHVCVIEDANGRHMLYVQQSTTLQNPCQSSEEREGVNVDLTTLQIFVFTFEKRRAVKVNSNMLQVSVLASQRRQVMIVLIILWISVLYGR